MFYFNPVLTSLKTLSEAGDRFKIYESQDPFPEVSPALLNSSHIRDYVLATGMIFPFDETKEGKKLKSASYEVEFLGTAHYIDDNNKPQNEKIVKGKIFEIQKNSIVFVELETFFRLPKYIALRFNLSINHVHRGLLLGTGPLVDPGFVGKLLVPVHNLTAKPYVIKGGDGFIWVEFTKLSAHPDWDASAHARSPYIEFPSDKRERTAQDYFDRASGGLPSRSSIPEEMQQAKEKIQEAKKESGDAIEKAEQAVKDIKKSNLIAAIIGAITLAASAVGIIVAVIMPTLQLIDSYRAPISEIATLKVVIEQLKTEVDRLKKPETPSTNIYTNVQPTPPSSNASTSDALEQIPKKLDCASSDKNKCE